MSLMKSHGILAGACTTGSSPPPLRATRQRPPNSSATTTPNTSQPHAALTTENNQLRAARKHTASPAHPDERLSRQELAELVNAWAWGHHRKNVELSANYAGQLEHGKIRWPSKLYREASRENFGVSTDSALGFADTRSRRTAAKLDDVNRKQSLHTATLGVGTLTLEPVASSPEDSEPIPIPHRIGATEI